MKLRSTLGLFIFSNHVHITPINAAALVPPAAAAANAIPEVTTQSEGGREIKIIIIIKKSTTDKTKIQELFSNDLTGKSVSAFITRDHGGCCCGF